MKVDDRNLQKKLNRLRAGLKDFLDNIHKDAAQFLHAKLVEEVLNGEVGESYPKNYPAGISEGATGFVGTISSNLRRAIQFDQVNATASRVYLDGSASAIGVAHERYANYGEIIAVWSEFKYGKNYFDIALELYGDFVRTTIFEELQKIIKALNAGRNYQYKNPFPV